ncbi:MAG: GTP-binding protein [Candidatus Latescibacterota bacterium]|nr:GTP-binding protein [Candidatus Latescibacterota bacterium]
MNQITSLPTNVFTGLLGVGKTSAILSLLGQKTDPEKWAVLVNEFGDIPIDQTQFQETEVEGVFIREVAGGCLCCTAGVSLQVALTLLLREVRPDRLLIEMSGMGHPGSVLFNLREGSLSEALDLRSTICLVDPRDVDESDIRNSQIFQDQVHLADVLIANKTDLANEEEIQFFDKWSRGLYPAKHTIARVERGVLDSSWLDIDSDPLKVPLFPDLHEADDHKHLEQTEAKRIEPGSPYRSENHGYDRYACGWIFSSEDIFEEERLLLTLAEDDDIERIKGAFRIGGDAILLNRTGQEIESWPTAYARDSRVEVISRSPNTDWEKLEAELIACLKTTIQPV